MEIPVIAHNSFGFDLHYFIKGFIASAWCSKELKIVGNNLTHINFSKIAGEIKFIDSLKYYQKNLAELARTLSEEEKAAVKKLTENFFNQHHYFINIWVFLNSEKRGKKLEIVSERKCIIPYELIIGMESFVLTSEKDFWERTEFFSDLKQSAVTIMKIQNIYIILQNEKFRRYE